MESDPKEPFGNILPFPRGDRRKRAAEPATGDSLDHGPSPEESLRIMRAFVGIKNSQVRANLIEMVEGAAQPRTKTPGSASE
jgi:hypothetical protein